METINEFISALKKCSDKLNEMKAHSSTDVIGLGDLINDLIEELKSFIYPGGTYNINHIVLQITDTIGEIETIKDEYEDKTKNEIEPIINSIKLLMNNEAFNAELDNGDYYNMKGYDAFFFKKKYEYKEINIDSNWLATLVNYDFSGVEDNEEEEIKKFDEDLVKKGFKLWSDQCMPIEGVSEYEQNCNCIIFKM